MEDAVIVQETVKEDPKAGLMQLVKSSESDESNKLAIQNTLGSFFSKAAEWTSTIESIVITSPDEVGKMKMAREGRLTLRDMRLEAKKLVEAKRSEIKKRMESDVANDKLWLKSWQMVESVFEGLEEKLEEKEKFAEVWKATKRAELKADRLVKLAPYSVAANPETLADMDDQMFEIMLAGYEKARLDKIEADRLEEVARLEAIDAENKRQEEIKAENERLKKEREEQDKKIQEQEEARIKAEKEQAEKLAEAKAKANKEKEEIEAKAKKERDEAEAKRLADAKIQADKLAAEKAESERLAAKLKAQADAAEKAKKDAELADKKAASAPDKEKLVAFAASISALILPTMASEDGKKVSAEISAKVESFSKWIIQQSSAL